MHGLAKGLIGAGVASLLAWGSHAMGGATYINDLESEMSGALADAGALSDPGALGASLRLQRDPLARVATISGVTDASDRARIEQQLLAGGRIRTIIWADDLVDASVTDGEADTAALSTGIEDVEAVSGASEEQVADCQSDLDAFMADRVVVFESGSAELAAPSISVISGLAERLTACTGMSVAVGGHTDATGTDAVNQQLSQARADAVAAALAGRGVAPVRITATGYGSSRPLVEGNGANAANRRIEFTLDAGGASSPAEGE